MEPLANAPVQDNAVQDTCEGVHLPSLDPLAYSLGSEGG